MTFFQKKEKRNEAKFFARFKEIIATSLTNNIFFEQKQSDQMNLLQFHSSHGP